MSPYRAICKQRMRTGKNIISNKREVDNVNDVLEYLKDNLKWIEESSSIL